MKKLNFKAQPLFPHHFKIAWRSQQWNVHQACFKININWKMEGLLVLNWEKRTEQWQ